LRDFSHERLELQRRVGRDQANAWLVADSHGRMSVLIIEISEVAWLERADLIL